MPPGDPVFLCRTCAPAGGLAVSISALQFLAAAGVIAPDRLADARLTERASRELESVHRRLLALHLDKDLKSARVLREMRQAL